MSTAKERIVAEVDKLLRDQNALLKLLASDDDTLAFGTKYQAWYSRALKIVSVLAPDRLAEFRFYYERDLKRKVYASATYSIQDYAMGMPAALDYLDKPEWDTGLAASLRVLNQFQILA